MKRNRVKSIMICACITPQRGSRIRGELTARFPAVSSHWQWIDPSAAEEDEAVTQEGAEYLSNQWQQTSSFYNWCNAFL